MTATDLHAEALAAIAERRGLVSAGTPGGPRWEIGPDDMHGPSQSVIYPSDSDSAIAFAGCEDATLIVASVNDYGPLLDLAEHTLIKHAPERRHVGNGYHGGPAQYRDICGPGCRENWPCSDAAAALRSLGLGAE